jgi:hypothetical protein
MRRGCPGRFAGPELRHAYFDVTAALGFIREAVES